jgi:hypothetical protein
MGRTDVVKIRKSQDGMQINAAVVLVDGIGFIPQVSAGLPDPGQDILNGWFSHVINSPR